MRISKLNSTAMAILALLVISAALFVQNGFAQDRDDDMDNMIDERVAVTSIRPVEDIIDTELIVTNFSANGTATLPIETSVAVACTLVYGTTEAFGQLTLDQDMAGGTHSVHSPLLSGLDPDTTYYFRVQGVDDAGIIYLSDVMTFTTPATDEISSDNLLSPLNGASVMGVSSNFSNQDNDGTWGILNAIDDNPGTAWSSNGDGDEAWVEIALGQRSRINEVAFWTRSMSNNTAQIFQFTITTETGEVFGPFDLPDAEQSYQFEVDIIAETVRFDVMSSNGGNTGAVEIALYGEAVED
ncbi:MAG: discoidin domain-containing protein [Anaerolineae bacterium]|nr:discoidin domain-containing protein [Anaerolineae bacterium]MDQ7037365.1 discoidin domain-containing protein [Anaerolineae bacterium]